jgi:hypothetical protein
VQTRLKANERRESVYEKVPTNHERRLRRAQHSSSAARININFLQSSLIALGTD